MLGFVLIERRSAGDAIVEVKTAKRVYTMRYPNLSLAAVEARRLELISSEWENYLLSPLARVCDAPCERLDEDALLRAGYVLA